MDPLDYLFALEKFGVKFGLAKIRALATALGEPQHSFRSILIAGTNGKGSVTAMVDHALRASGLRVGRYTSPHLIGVEERFAVDGTPVATKALESVIDDIRVVIDRLLAKGGLDAPPTFFEVTTAAAFELFRRAGVEFAVLEVGMGGRLDSTNIVNPVATAITSIDFDHERYLGNTLSQIAGEKAGIIRRGVPLVAGPLPPDAHEVIRTACATEGADLIEANRDVHVDTTREHGRTSVHVRTPTRDYGWVPLGLRGEHQVPNALVAIRVLEQLERIVPVGPTAVAAGLRDVRWPGRLQLIEAPNGRRALLDAAHNPAGARALAGYLRHEYPKPLPMVFGAMRDKNVAVMLETLLPVASTIVMTAPANARAYSPQELAALAGTLSLKAAIEIEPKPGAALARAWTHGPLACAAGSIFLVGELLADLGPSARDL